MNTMGMFELEVQAGKANDPARVAIILQSSPSSNQERQRIIDPCTSFDDLDGRINQLQDELDELREQARRLFEAT